jgi:GDPmannose 4,6-dehydratase
MFNTKRIDHIFEDKKIYNKNLFLYHGDLTDSLSISSLLNSIKPDEIYNLGAQSHVQVSFETPEYTLMTDALGTLRILESMKILNLQKTKFYQASTSELFGEKPSKTNSFDENSLMIPKSPYGVSKLYSYFITKIYREAYGFYACNGILFNHESPRRGETFVTRKITMYFAKRILGSKEILHLNFLNTIFL